MLAETEVSGGLAGSKKNLIAQGTEKCTLKSKRETKIKPTTSSTKEHVLG